MNKEWRSQKLSLRNNEIHYLVFGSGQKILFCFHGFGETAFSFLTIKPSLQKNYTVISIDLPYHGLTRWNETYFTPLDLKEVIIKLLEVFNKNRFSIIGYSIGGKLAIGAMQQLPHLVDDLILLAPDGIRKNIWYNLSVYPKWGRKIFLHMIKHPKNYFSLISFLSAMRIIPDALKKFLETQLETPEKRQLSFDVWVCVKEFNTPPKEIKRLIKIYKIKTVLFYGKYDKVIPAKTGNKFARNLAECQLVVLPKGHQLIKDYLNDELMKVLPQ